MLRRALPPPSIDLANRSSRRARLRRLQAVRRACASGRSSARRLGVALATPSRPIRRPRWADSAKPITSTGMPGPAALIGFAAVVDQRRCTLPAVRAADERRADLSVPVCTITVAVGPRPGSMRGLDHAARAAGAFGLAFSSSTSAWSRISLQQVVHALPGDARKPRRTRCRRPSPSGMQAAAPASCCLDAIEVGARAGRTC